MRAYRFVRQLVPALGIGVLCSIAASHADAQPSSNSRVNFVINGNVNTAARVGNTLYIGGSLLPHRTVDQCPWIARRGESEHGPGHTRPCSARRRRRRRRHDPGRERRLLHRRRLRSRRERSPTEPSSSGCKWAAGTGVRSQPGFRSRPRACRRSSLGGRRLYVCQWTTSPAPGGDRSRNRGGACLCHRRQQLGVRHRCIRHTNHRGRQLHPNRRATPQPVGGVRRDDRRAAAVESRRRQHRQRPGGGCDLCLRRRKLQQRGRCRPCKARCHRCSRQVPPSQPLLHRP